MPFVSSSIYKKALQLAIREGLSTELLGENHTLNLTDAYVPMTSLLDVYELAEDQIAPRFENGVPEDAKDTLWFL